MSKSIIDEIITSTKKFHIISLIKNYAQLLSSKQIENIIDNCDIDGVVPTMTKFCPDK